MAITTKRITMRQGSAADWEANKTKILSGELAIVNDTEEAYFSPSDGKSKRLATEDDVSRLKEQIANGTGLTPEAIDKLDEIGNHIPFTSATGGKLWDELITLLRSGSSGGGEEEPDTPDNPEATLTSISVTYTGGDVASGTELSSLTGITVTGTYSDGSTSEITGYVLSGEILEGENTITVTYSGKTATFKVVGIAESGGEDVTPELPTDGLKAFFDFRGAIGGMVGTAYGIDKATIGDGGVYVWQTTNINEYGATNAFWYTEDTTKPANYDIGTEFTFAMLSYDPTNTGLTILDGYGALSNSVLCSIDAKYNNTSGSTANVGAQNSSLARTTGWHNYVISVKEKELNIYIDGNLERTLNGADYEDFVSWYSIAKLKPTYNTTRTSAWAIYNKALSDVEIVELLEYYKTLEVA